MANALNKLNNNEKVLLLSVTMLLSFLLINKKVLIPLKNSIQHRTQELAALTRSTAPSKAERIKELTELKQKTDRFENKIKNEFGEDYIRRARIPEVKIKVSGIILKHNLTLLKRSNEETDTPPVLKNSAQNSYRRISAAVPHKGIRNSKELNRHDYIFSGLKFTEISFRVAGGFANTYSALKELDGIKDLSVINVEQLTKSSGENLLITEFMLRIYYSAERERGR